MSRTDKQVTLRPTEKLKGIIKMPSIQEQFHNSMGKNADAFLASVVELFSGNNNLQQCDPGKVVQQALKAATLKLPINPNLGFAWIVPFKNEPTFQIGYKGYIQLAMRTGQYRCINADMVLEGMKVNRDLLSGSVSFSGEPTSEKAQGYFAHFELINGFTKTLYMTHDEVEAHAKRFSRSYSSKYSPWQTDFAAMALKTVLSKLLRTYGIMTTEMANAVAYEPDPSHPEKDEANSESFADAVKTTAEVIDEETGEITDGEPELPEVFDV